MNLRWTVFIVLFVSACDQDHNRNDAGAAPIVPVVLGADNSASPQLQVLVPNTPQPGKAASPPAEPIKVDDPSQHDDPSQNPGDKPALRIVSLDYSGSGCPMGTVVSNISPDSQAFTFSFSAFSAEIGPGLELAKASKICSLILTVEHSPHWTFAPLDTFFRGFQSLGQGAEADLLGYINSKNSPQSGLDFNEKFLGPSEGDFVLANHYQPKTEDWSPCHGKGPYKIFLETRLNLSDPAGLGASGLITVDTVDGALQQTMQLQWKPCR
ncbi:MAG: DUF4360 domain-containing protein [Proteobacteria bacterium]|nr:DUF4360 domain-containing protein [Pseudomonadota bacterium]